MSEQEQGGELHEQGGVELVVLDGAGKAKRLRLRFATAGQVRRSVARVNNLVLNGQLGSKEANAIIYGCQSILQALRLDEYEQQMALMVQEIARIRAAIDERN